MCRCAERRNLIAAAAKGQISVRHALDLVGGTVVADLTDARDSATALRQRIALVRGSLTGRAI
jgi:hypothetical protein